MRWFEASLEGSYAGTPVSAADGPGRRYQLQVYRAALRELRWIEPPADPSTTASMGATVWQSRIDHAHLAGVRGPGTWYEGPIFDVRIHSVQLTHPTECAGRSYGRIVGNATGWLELPPPPAAASVNVTERGTAAAANSAGPNDGDPAAEPALEATIYHPDGAASEAEPIATADHGPGEAAAVSSKGPTTAKSPEGSSGMLPLACGVLLVAVALGLFRGPFAAGMWTLFMLPTLLARRLFSGVLRDSGFVRGVGYVLIAAQLTCASAQLSSSQLDGCAAPSLWPALGVVLMLFPAGLLPSIAPLACNAAALALILATSSLPDPDCGANPAAKSGEGHGARQLLPPSRSTMKRSAPNSA